MTITNVHVHKLNCTGSTPSEDAQWIREELHRWIHGMYVMLCYVMLCYVTVFIISEKCPQKLINLSNRESHSDRERCSESSSGKGGKIELIRA